MKEKPFYLAVRGVLFNKSNEVLLMQRAALSKNQPSFWEFPGGKVDRGESFADALVREFKEETGFDIVLKHVIASGEWEREDYKIAYLFLLVEKSGGTLTLSREHDDARWMDREQLKGACVTPQLEALKAQILAMMSAFT